jgi:hypothetical protein
MSTQSTFFCDLCGDARAIAPGAVNGFMVMSVVHSTDHQQVNGTRHELCNSCYSSHCDWMDMRSAIKHERKGPQPPAAEGERAEVPGVDWPHEGRDRAQREAQQRLQNVVNGWQPSAEQCYKYQHVWTCHACRGGLADHTLGFDCARSLLSQRST